MEKNTHYKKTSQENLNKLYFYDKQWYLGDIMVKYAWRKGIVGDGITVCVVDSGIYKHKDLHVDRDISKNDINDQDPGQNTHGTMVAGIICAQGNKYCIGVAPYSKLVSYNLIGTNQGGADIEKLAEYMLKHKNKIDIFNNSWGPSSDYIFPSFNKVSQEDNSYYEFIDELFSELTKKGRRGKGNIICYSSGNSSYPAEFIGPGQYEAKPYFGQVAYNGYLNSRYTITVGALSQNMLKTAYSEWGSAILCMGYGSYDLLTFEDYGLMTTFPSVNGFSPVTNIMNGTSGACPIVSGIVALLLSHNPELSWRDVKELISRSCYITDPEEFIQNGAGRYVSERYGYGVLNVRKIIKRAKKWAPLPKEVYVTAEHVYRGADQPNLENNTMSSYTATLNITENIIIETVQLFITINVDIVSSMVKKISDLQVILVSPLGTSVRMIRANSLLFSSFKDYPELDPSQAMQFFLEIPVLNELLRGEKSKGEWKIVFTDTVPDLDVDTIAALQKVKMDIYGYKNKKC